MDLIARIPTLAAAVATPLLFWLVVCLIGLAIERIAPAERGQRWPLLRLNLGFGAVNSVIVTLLNPLAGAAGVAIVNACGGGLIALADHGWALVASAALFIFAMDFME